MLDLTNWCPHIKKKKVHQIKIGNISTILYQIKTGAQSNQRYKELEIGKKTKVVGRIFTISQGFLLQDLPLIESDKPSRENRKRFTAQRLFAFVRLEALGSHFQTITQNNLKPMQCRALRMGLKQSMHERKISGPSFNTREPKIFWARSAWFGPVEFDLDNCKISNYSFKNQGYLEKFNIYNKESTVVRWTQGRCQVKDV